MSCVPAKTLVQARAELTHLHPQRSIASDGICASAKHHKQNPNSDHETGNALDITHDPIHGVDVDLMFSRIVARRDKRVKYLIRNKHICRSYDKPGIPAWTWAPYNGINPHTKHGHISIYPQYRNDTNPWWDIFTRDNPQDDSQDDTGDNMTAEEHAWLAAVHHEFSPAGNIPKLVKLVRELQAEVAELRKNK